MESQHMTQQTFSQFLGLSSASVSSVYTGRTKPTLNIVEAICQKIPGINLQWLLFGTGSMYENETVSPKETTSKKRAESVPCDRCLRCQAGGQISLKT